MLSPKAAVSSIEIASSPPPATPAVKEDGEGTGHKTPLAYTSPPKLPEGEQDLSLTQTIAASSPELPPLPPFPSIGKEEATPSAASGGGRLGEKGYYTASWGSPYQSIPQGYSDVSHQARRSSLGAIGSDDIDDGSPHQFGLSHLLPTRLPTYQGLTPTRPSTPTRARSVRDALLRARPPLNDNLVVEKSNWPSDTSSIGDRRSSQDSVSEWDLSRPALLLKPKFERASTFTEGTKGHKSREDNLTLRQEDIWEALGKQTREAADKMMESKWADTPTSPRSEERPAMAGREDSAFPRTNETAEALFSPGNVPDTNPLELAEPPKSATTSPTKKKLICKGKTCWILLPKDIPRSENGAPLTPLTRWEVAQKLENYEKAGYDTRGFNSWSGALVPYEPDIQAQNRAIYPEAHDFPLTGPRPRVRIANTKEWDEYVNLLREEKLRKLLGPEEPPRPSSVPLSRQSSNQFPQTQSTTFSPPPLSSSAASGQQIPGFPPGFVPGHVSRQSMASPVSSMGNPRAMGHMHRQSMFVSPPSFPQQPTPPGLSRWSPQHFARGSVSATSPAISAMSNQLPAGGIKSPVSPYQFPNQQGFPFPIGARDELLVQMQRQQQQLQAQQQAQAHQQHQFLAQRPSSTLQELQEVPEVEDEEELPVGQAKAVQPEIANPRPRHGKNVSVQLERDVGQDGYHLEDYIKKQYVQDDEESDEDDMPAAAVKLPVSEDEEPAPTTLKVINPDPDSAREDREKTVEPEDKGTPQLDGTPSSISKEEDSFGLTSPTSGSFTTSGHASKASSVSRFNVDAKEFKFNPSASFNPAVFSPDAFSFKPSAQPEAPTFNPSAQPFSGFGASVNAPAFNPAASFGSNFSGDFNFSSSTASFKPDAPAFQPGVSLGSNSETTNDGESRNRIFSSLDFHVVKPVKKSKAIPIVKPESPPRAIRDDDDLVEDEDGRFAPSDARNKRTRRGGDDGDEVPQFAMPTHPLDLEKTPEPNSGPKEGSATPTNEPSMVQLLTSPDSERGKDDSGFHDGSTAQSSKDESGVYNGPAAHAAKPSLFQRLSSAAASFPFTLEPDEPVRPKHQRQKSSLSATAKPFVFKAWSQQDAEPEPEPDSEPELELPATDEDDTRELVVDIAQQMKEQLPQASSPIRNISDQESAAAVVDKPRGASEAEDFDFDAQASFNDIDEVMKQFNEEGSDAGVERTETTFPQQSSSRPVTATSFDTPDLKPPVQPFRSDAPSPSPRRGLPQQYALVPPVIPDEEEEPESAVSRDPFGDQAAAAYESPTPANILAQQAEAEGTDWDDVISTTEDDKVVRARSKFFDQHVDTLLNHALSTRLEPLEQTLISMQQALALLSDQAGSRRPTRKPSQDSDADDEDEDEEVEGISPVRSRSIPRNRQFEKMRAAVQEVLAAEMRQQRQKTPPKEDIPTSTSGLGIDVTEFYQAIADVKASAAFFASKALQPEDIRDMMEDALSKNSIAKQIEDATDKGEAITALGPEAQQIAELERRLAEANERADQAVGARKTAEAREENVVKQLSLADEELRLLKAQNSDEKEIVKIVEKERSVLKEQILEQTNKLSSLADKNAAQEATLGEYRMSHDQWKKDLDAAQVEKDKLASTLDAMQFQAQEAMRVRESMRGRLSALRAEMSTAANQMAQQQAKWHRDDEEHRKRYEVLTARLGAEARTRERLEQEMERLETQEHEGMRLKVMLDETQASNARLEELTNSLKLESMEHQKTADRYAGEFREARESGHAEVQRTRVLMQAEIDAVNAHLDIVRSDLEAEVARMQNQLENHRMDADTAKEKHELILEQEADAKRDALRTAQEAREKAMQEQTAMYEQRLEELRQQHSRTLEKTREERSWAEARLGEEHNVALSRAVEDKARSEQVLNEKLSLADSKVEHLQDKILHLEGKLEVAKAAAQAAAVAAQSAKETSPIASTREAFLAQTIAPAAKLPEKISPQALRESIAVLQEQLQEREGRIEDLESELSEIDKDAPAKLKERDTEISWLRELLGVRQDDLSDLVNALAQPTFDREAVRNAAIRIRTSLQMELQEKERLMNDGLVGGVQAQVMPALASLSNFASPKAAQLAAAIGNWRKNSAVPGTPSGLGLNTQSMSATTSRTQTPSKPSGQSQNFFQGLMTPPQSNLRRTPSPATAGVQQTEMRRPSSSYSSASRANISPRTTRRAEKQHAFAFDRVPSPPPRLSTPPLLRKASYDQDAESASGDFSAQGFYYDESTADGDAVPFATFGAGMQ